MKSMLILLTLTAAISIGASEANAFELVRSATVLVGGVTGGNGCNGIVEIDGCVCPENSGSATCNPGQTCQFYFWAGWPECLLG